MSGGESLTFETHLNPAPVSEVERTGLLADPGFGRIFTDHMVTVRYTEGKGWHDARVEPYGPIPVSPASAVLHYAQEIFEGLKAYHAADGSITLFRPDANARRFQRSAERMSMPKLPEELFLGSLRKLLEVDRAWVPSQDEASLYLRPFMFASEVFLGVRPAHEYLYMVIASPAGAYFSGGVKPVSLWVSENFTRAAPGGTGEAKCGGNYAASLAAQAEAMDAGCDQVVFLDAVERRWIDELGGMNVFCVYDDGTLVTPQLNGSILAGITRDSVITLARDMGLTVVERPYALEEMRTDAASGRLREAFACGTAAVITPIGVMRSASGDFTVADGGTGEITARMRSTLLDIQHGRAEDPYGWVHRIV
ncbi:MAG: branched-chain amino acid aminotransferase [Micromonosporaceae bacterium]